MKARTDNLTLGRVLWRSFFLQASWNTKGQQNLGAAAVMEPALNKIYGKGNPARTEVLQSYLEAFNTQPYMSGPIFGALVKAEEMREAGELPRERLARFRLVLTTAFAAIGDAFFWNACLPAASVLGLFWSLYESLWGSFVFFVGFNMAHLTIRIWGFRVGYKEGLYFTAVFERLHLPLKALRLRIILAGGLGALAVWSVWSGLKNEPADWLFTIGGFLGGLVVFSFTRLLRKGLPVEVLVYALLASLAGVVYLAEKGLV